MSFRRSACLVGIVLVAGTVSAVPAGAALPATDPGVIHCGDEITGNFTLDRNLLNCKKDAFVVKANNITIDLGGFTLAGDAKKGGSGIVNEGFDNVQITNGTITKFDNGVVFKEKDKDGNPVSSNGATISQLTLEKNKNLGVKIEAGSSNTLTQNEILDNVDSFELIGDSNQVTNNDFTKGGSSKAKPSIKFTGNSNTAFDNEIDGGGTGIQVKGNDNTLEKNDFRKGKKYAVQILGNRNVVEHNDIEESSDRGIWIQKSGDKDDIDCATPTSTNCFFGRDNFLEKNRIKRGKKDGIFVEGEDTRILNNSSKENKGDGIDVRGSHPVLIDNSAKRNGGSGISAKVEGAQGRDNSAKDNKGKTQCSPSQLCD